MTKKQTGLAPSATTDAATKAYVDAASGTAGTKTSALTHLLGTSIADGDSFPVVDVSDTTQAASGSLDYTTAADLRRYLIGADPLAPSGALAETFSRRGATISNTLAVLSSGRLSLVAIPLVSGMVITSITFVAGTTAAGTPTHQLFALFDSSLALLRSSADATTAAWALSTAKTLSLTSTYTITATGLFFLGVMVAATTVPTLQGINGQSVVNAFAPILSGTSSTGLTTAMPNPAAAQTGVGVVPYAYVS